MKRIFKQNNAFMSMDIIMMTAVLLAAAALWHTAIIAMEAQEKNAHRLAASFLLQGYLNRIEHNINNGVNEAPSAREKISLNGQNFIIEQQLQYDVSDARRYSICTIKVKAEWQYGNQTQSEYQTRQVVVR